MSKILDFINVPKRIINYRKRKIIEKYTGKKESGSGFVTVVKWLLGIAYIVAVVMLNVKQQSRPVLIITALFSLCMAVLLALIGKNRSWSFGEGKSNLTHVILKDEEGKNIKTWELNNKNSLLIGKKTKNNEADIDLSETVYASLVSREHAILNFTGKEWYFEDAGSSNGSGIKRKRDGKKFKVEEGKAYKVYSGDTIYIANTQLYVK